MRWIFLVVFLALPLYVLTGCGGGGGGGGGNNGGGSSTGTLVIQLRDSASLPVDGIVFVEDQDRGTSSGNVTFSKVSAGNQSVRAEVNGVSTTQVVTVGAGVTTTATIVISASATSTPAPTSPPPPPF